MSEPTSLIVSIRPICPTGAVIPRAESYEEAKEKAAEEKTHRAAKKEAKGIAEHAEASGDSVHGRP
jgi:hypothetical protein